MNFLSDVFFDILLESDGKLSTIVNSINNKKPISIYYDGPSNEVLSGKRIDILPIVMGKHIKSDNIVIWAYVTKGVSKKGIPNWKMFRLDRISDININNNETFDVQNIPNYVKNKPVELMKSLSSVIAKSDDLPVINVEKETTSTLDSSNNMEKVKQKIEKDTENEWKNKQRKILGWTPKPDEEDKKEFEKISQEKISQLNNEPDTEEPQDIDNEEEIEEPQDIDNEEDTNINEIKNRFKRLLL